MVVADPDAARAAEVAARHRRDGRHARGRQRRRRRGARRAARPSPRSPSRASAGSTCSPTRTTSGTTSARDDASDAYLHDVLDYNAVSILRMARAVLPAMRAQGGGQHRVALVDRRLGGGRPLRRDARARRASCRASPIRRRRCSQNGLTRFLAAHPRPVRHHGERDRPRHDRLAGARMARLTEAEREAFVGRARRSVASSHVEDTVGALLHLASDDSACMTGQVLVVDAGLVMLG